MEVLEVESPNEARNRRLANLKRGNSVNLTGRPKGLAQLVREQTDDGKELVKIMMEIVRGELVVEKTFGDRTYEEYPSHKDRIAAAQWLADRGFGKAVETNLNVDINGNSEALADVIARQLMANGVSLQLDDKTPAIES